MSFLRIPSLLLVGAFLLALGLMSVVGVRVLMAQTPSTPEEVGRQYEEFRSKPKYVGELNGFTFYPSSTRPSALQGPPACAGSSARWATEGELLAAGLNFAPGYQPPGTRQVGMTGSVCRNEVVSVNRSYSSDRGGFAVTRLAGPPQIREAAPREHLQVATLDGRAAVISPPVVLKHRMTIWMRDNQSLWTVSCIGIDPQECAKIAAEVK